VALSSRITIRGDPKTTNRGLHSPAYVSIGRLYCVILRSSKAR
jgi:hypothetical protein